jgi:hypothetical protein
MTPQRALGASAGRLCKALARSGSKLMMAARRVWSAWSLLVAAREDLMASMKAETKFKLE